MRLLLLLLLCCGIAVAASAQTDCYESRLKRGNEAFDAADYDKAILRWQAAIDYCELTDTQREVFKQRIRDAEKAKTPEPVTVSKPNLDIEPSTVLVQGGTFLMGSEDGDSDEKPVHSVTLSAFYMGKYEITNAQFAKFLNEKGNQTEGSVEWINLSGSYDGEKCRIVQSGSSFSVASGYDNYPVIFVSWYGARAYCTWLASKTGKFYRLPTEAEWEYAAGNGNRHTKYSWGNGDPSLLKGGNVADETVKKKFSNWIIFTDYTDGFVFAAPVGSFVANDLELYDMSGNVWEWCSDRKDTYSSSAQQNPTGSITGSIIGSYRVFRGGSWNSIPLYCCVADRSEGSPTLRNNYLGFRVVISFQ